MSGGSSPRSAACRLDHERAARLAGAAAARRAELGAPLGPHDINLAERHLGPVRAALGTRAFDAAWDVGLGLSFDAALLDAGLAGHGTTAVERGDDG